MMRLYHSDYYDEGLQRWSVSGHGKPKDPGPRVLWKMRRFGIGSEAVAFEMPEIPDDYWSAEHRRAVIEGFCESLKRAKEMAAAREGGA